MNRILWPCLAMGFALVPALVFVRGTTLSIAAGFVLFLPGAPLEVDPGVRCGVLSAQSYICIRRQPQLMEDATNVNLTTGEGFSHRFDRWGMAFQSHSNRTLHRPGIWAGIALLESDRKRRPRARCLPDGLARIGFGRPCSCFWLPFFNSFAQDFFCTAIRDFSPTGR